MMNKKLFTWVNIGSTLGLLVLRHLLHAALVDFITFVFTVISYKRASFDQMKYFIEN